jgi:LDH2 family malate/lactate/ureidoglycolate dehydrogenase
MAQAPARLRSERLEGISGILFPGECEFQTEKLRRAEDIAITSELQPQLDEIARLSGVEVPR